jgi:SAM-dependent methyltransferase
VTQTELAPRPDLGSIALGLHAQAAVQEVGRALGDAGVTGLVLAGPPLHVRLHGGAAGSADASLSLLVPGSQATRAEDALFASGWRRRAGAGRVLESEGFLVRISAEPWGEPIAGRLLRPLRRALWAGARPGPEGLLEPGPEALLVLLLARAASGLPVRPLDRGDLAAALRFVEDRAAVERLAARCRLGDALRQVSSGVEAPVPGALRYDRPWSLITATWDLARRIQRTAEDVSWDPRIRSALRSAGGRSRREGVATFRGTVVRYPVGLVFPPRSLTEPLVELALERLDERERELVLDVGTGTGAVALTVARERPASRVVGVDISREAVHCAWGNAARNRIANVRFAHGHLLEPIPAAWSGRVSLITSNIPFVAPRERDVVRRHGYPEGTAIGPGADGLGLVRELLDSARDTLRPGGWLVAQLVPWHWEVLEPSLRELGFVIEELRPSMGAMVGRVRKG